MLGNHILQIQADMNEISELATNTFTDLANLTRVNLTNNRLTSFSLSALTLDIHHTKGKGKPFIPISKPAQPE